MAATLFSFYSAEEQKLFFKQERPEEETVGSFGETLTLDCEAGGSPSPTIHWLYNGERIIQVSNFFIDTCTSGPVTRTVKCNNTAEARAEYISQNDWSYEIMRHRNLYTAIFTKY